MEESQSELITCAQPGTPVLGLAMDIGSTKIAMYLVNLETGSTLATCGLMNPQIAYGEDVISRIAFANRNEDNRHLLQKVLIQAINEAAAELCAQNGLLVEQIVDVVVCGNTVIHHTFCGLPLEQLGSAPYVPVVQDAISFAAAEIGLHCAPGAHVYLPPNIAGYVGADHVSALTATHTFSTGVTTVLVDIGTNTEISLIHQDQIYSCSCASGPAFEGAHIHEGMRAVAGAIEKVQIHDGQIQVHTIANQRPLGLCGSGILSAIAEMRKAALIDGTGCHSPERRRFKFCSGSCKRLRNSARDHHHA